MNSPLWTLSDVSLGRSQRRLDAVTVTILPGVTAVIGPSGAGKTSLLNLLVGFEAPTGGRITQSIEVPAARLPISWGPPDFGLWPHLNVRQHLETVQPPRTVAGKPAGHTFDALLSAFHLSSLQGADVGRLSQGERSRLALARALAADPAVLVLDEPLVHVDPVHVDEYWQVLREQCRERQTSLIFSTHSPEVVLREATRVICLDAGRVAFEGLVEALYRRPPTPRLSLFLGPANWFERGTAAAWITSHDNNAADLCLRPEQLAVAIDAGSPLVVESSRAGPLVTVSQFRDERTQQLRSIWHRTADCGLQRGSRVLLRLCAVLVLLLLVVGCQRSSASPAISVTAFRTLPLPVEGATIPAPRSVAVSADGEVYVLDKAGRVLVYDSGGEFDRSWWMPDHEIGKPEGICILDDGRVVVADTHYHRVVTFDRSGNVLDMFGELGEAPGQFIYPVSVTRDAVGNLYVAEYGGNDRIQKFTREGEWVLTMGSFGTGAGQFQRPSGIVWRANNASASVSDSSAPGTSGRGASAGGTLYVADAINNRIQAFADDGEFLGIVAGWDGGGAEVSGGAAQSGAADASGISLEYPYDIALGPDRNLYVVEYAAGRVTALTAEGKLIGAYGQSGREDAQFWTPWGIAVGSGGRIYVADTGNKRIVELTP
jgi:iron(III) transport system ATP-binding protein